MGARLSRRRWLAALGLLALPLRGTVLAHEWDDGEAGGVMPRPSSPTRPASPNRSAISLTPLYNLILAEATLRAFWPLDDAAGSTTAREVTGNATAGTHIGAVVPGVGPGIDGKTATQYSGSPYAFPTGGYTPGQTLPPYTDLSTGSWQPLVTDAYALELFIQTTAGAGGTANIVNQLFGADNGGMLEWYYNRGTDAFGNSSFQTRAALAQGITFAGLPAYTEPVYPSPSDPSPGGATFAHLLVKAFPGPPPQFQVALNGVSGALGTAGGSTIRAGAGSWRIGYPQWSVTGAGVITYSSFTFSGLAQYATLYVGTPAQITAISALAHYEASLLGDPVTYQHMVRRGSRNYYPLTDAASSAYATDAAGNLPGAHTLATPGVAGLIGNATSYDGSSAFTQLFPGQPAGSVPNGGVVSVDAWVNPSSISGIAAAIVGRGDQGSSTLHYLLAKNAGDGRLSIIVKLDATTYSYVSTAALVANAWSHVALVLVGGQAPAVYLNGVQSNLDVGTTIPAATLSAAPVTTIQRIGAAGNTPANYLPGSIQHVALSTNALGAADFAARYSAGLAAAGRQSA